MDKTGALTGYGTQIFERDCYICQYCNLDGRLFENWLLLTIDHIIPRAQKGSNDPNNLVTACTVCNTLENRAKIESFEQKKKLILAKREEYRKWWEQNIKPRIIK